MLAQYLDYHLGSYASFLVMLGSHILKICLTGRGHWHLHSQKVSRFLDLMLATTRTSNQVAQKPLLKAKDLYKTWHLNQLP